MAYVDPDLLHSGFDKLATFITNNSAAITTGGGNPATYSTKTTTAKGNLDGPKTERDKKKTELATAQDVYAAAAKGSYNDFTSLIDAVAGNVGKQSPLGEQVLGIRKHVTGSDQPSPSKPQPSKPA